MVRLRSPVYDHSYIGVPFRRLSMRRSGDEPVDDFKAISLALLEACTPKEDSTDFKEKFKSSASRHLGWTFAEIDLHFELFSVLWAVEHQQEQEENEDTAAFSRLLCFALFLSLQLNELRHAKRRSSLESFNIPAPFEFETARREQQSGEEIRVHLVVEARKTEKIQRLMFMQQRMADIIGLLLKIESQCLLVARKDDDTTISFQVMQALKFLLMGNVDPIVGKTAREAAAFLESHLKVLDDEESSASAQQASLNVVRGVVSNDLVLVPPPQGNNKTTMCSTIVLANHSATILSLTPALHSYVLGCFDCLVVLGPTSGIVTVEHCERVRIVGSCERLRLINCTDCRVNVWTGTRPIIADCRGITLGPFNARFPHAKQTCERICPTIANGKWKRPLSCDAGMGLDDDDLNLCVIQPVEDFAFEPVHELFPAEEQQVCNSPALPAEYQAKLSERRELAMEMFELVNKAENGGNLLLPMAIQQAFKEWLLSDASLTEGLGGQL